MDKLTATERTSADLIAANIAALQQLFPELVTEGKDGAVVNVDALKELVGDRTVTDAEERFGLHWHGKRAARRLALTPSLGTLRPCPEESVDWETTQNLMIEGDNLEVLKLLQKSYAGKVKLIYIDPPYNQDADVIYKDDYKEQIENYRKLVGEVGADGSVLTTVKTSDGRWHSTWLSMMYPRLRLGHSLLSHDGLMFVSISDPEVGQLRCILNEIFGETNFIGNVIWNSTKSVTNTALISVSHTHTLIYARNKEHFVENRSQFRLPEGGEGFLNRDSDPRGPWKADPFQVGGERPNQLYEIVNPKTGQIYRPNPGCSWKNEFRVFQELLKENRIVFGVGGEAGPQRKRFLSEAEERGKVAKTLWDDIDTTTNATRDLNNLLGPGLFPNPKPLDLVERCLQLGTAHWNEAVVMDFFAGSATTGHAVMAQNAADGGNRRYILVQLPEPLDAENKDQKVAAEFCDKLGKPRTIAEITKERLRRAGAKIKKENPLFAGDLGFRVFKLDSTNLREWDSDPQSDPAQLELSAEHLKTDRSELDILYEVLLKAGFDLCAPVAERAMAGKTVRMVGGVLFACLASRIGRDEVEALATGMVLWRKEVDPIGDTSAYFRDDAFADDVAKTNLTAILKQGGFKAVRSL